MLEIFCDGKFYQSKKRQTSKLLHGITFPICKNSNLLTDTNSFTRPICFPIPEKTDESSPNHVSSERLFLGEQSYLENNCTWRNKQHSIKFHKCLLSGRENFHSFIGIDIFINFVVSVDRKQWTIINEALR